MRAIKAIDYSPWMFVTSVLESKLDQTTMFEWQKHSQGSKEVPDYLELLEFLDLLAQATENTKGEPERKHSSNPLSKKAARPSYVANTDETCVACKKVNHPLSTPASRSKLYHMNEKWAWSGWQIVSKLPRQRTLCQEVPVAPEM